jgi:hypothetical protein
MADRFVAAARASRDAALDLFKDAHRPRSRSWEPTLLDTLHVEMVDDAGASLGSVVVDCRLRAARGRIEVVAPAAARNIGPIDVGRVLALEEVMQVPTDAPPSRELLHLHADDRIVLVERDATGVRSVRDLTDDERGRYIDTGTANVSIPRHVAALEISFREEPARLDCRTSQMTPSTSATGSPVVAFCSKHIVRATGKAHVARSTR